jgi:hypothetical protein
MDVQTPVVITADYASITAIHDICEPWIEAWGGDEWGESMRYLLGATHTDYGLDDEDCARVARILWKNLDALKDWMDAEGHQYGLNEPDVRERAEREARKARDYWLKGGNLGDFGDTIAKTRATIDTLPGWLFGEAT